MTNIHVIDAHPIVKPFYVYIHKYASGPKEGTVFYVGKGKGRRIKEKSNRNTHWGNIVNKYGYTVSIVSRFELEQCAFSFERALIKFYGREKLCNLTDGGEGMSGFERSEKQKKEHSIRMSGVHHPQYGKPHNDEMKNRLSIIAKTNEKSINARLLMQASKRVTIYCSNGHIFGSIKDACDFIREKDNKNASPQNISAASLGKLNSAYGFKWSRTPQT